MFLSTDFPPAAELGEADIDFLLEYAVEAFEARRMRRQAPPINSTVALNRYLRLDMGDLGRERFRVLFLDKQLKLIADETLAQGTVDHAPVYPREVMKRALELDASSVILVHNHPSGDPTPSTADIDMTRQIVEAGRALKITVHDHVVVGADGVASFRALGLI